MENFGFSGLARTLYQRVLLSYRTTFIGIAIAAGDATLEYLKVVELPQWAHLLVGLLASAFLLVKEQNKGDLPAGAKQLLLVVLVPVSLSASSCAHWNPTPGQDAQLINCASQGVLTAAVELIPKVFAALSGSHVDWGQALEDLFKAEGPKALCAGQVVSDVLGGRSSPEVDKALLAKGVGIGGSEVSPVLQARVEAWLDLHRTQYAPGR
jgi:hypothetical protein